MLDIFGVELHIGDWVAFIRRNHSVLLRGQVLMFNDDKTEVQVDCFIPSEPNFRIWLSGNMICKSAK